MESQYPTVTVSLHEQFILVLNHAGISIDEIQAKYPDKTGTVIVDNTLAVGFTATRYCKLLLINGVVDRNSVVIIDDLPTEAKCFISSVLKKYDYLADSHRLSAKCKVNYLAEVQSWQKEK